MMNIIRLYEYECAEGSYLVITSFTTQYTLHCENTKHQHKLILLIFSVPRVGTKHLNHLTNIYHDIYMYNNDNYLVVLQFQWIYINKCQSRKIIRKCF